MERTLSSDDNLAERVIRNNDVQWSLPELQDILDVIGDMPVDRLRALAQADREGRCVVLPAKTVFEITWDAGPDCDLACPVSVDTHGDCSFCDHGKQFVYERTCKQECIDQIGKGAGRWQKMSEILFKAKRLDRGDHVRPRMVQAAVSEPRIPRL